MNILTNKVLMGLHGGAHQYGGEIGEDISLGAKTKKLIGLPGKDFGKLVSDGVRLALPGHDDGGVVL